MGFTDNLYREKASLDEVSRTGASKLKVVVYSGATMEHVKRQALTERADVEV